MTICCGMALDDTLGKYGCTNCEGENQTMPTIRESIQAQANRMGLTAYAISQQCGVDKKGKRIVSVVHVQAYLNGDKDMTSERIDAILNVLDLEVKRRR